MRNTLFFIFLFVSTLVFGQLAEPLVGKEYNISKKENFSGFIGETNIGLFTADYIYYSKRKQELIIKQFHKGDLSYINSHNLYGIIDEGYTNEPEELFYQNEQFYLFSRMQSIRDKTELLALEVFSMDCDKIKHIIIDTVSNDEVQYIQEAEDKHGFVVAKHLRYTQLIEQEIELTRINTTGEIKWNKRVRSPMALQSLRIERIIFNDQTPVYFLCNYAYDIRTGEEATNQLVNNKYALWAYDYDNNFLKEFEIRLKKKWVNGISMSLNSKNNLVVSGYFNETKNSTINGLFSIIINSNLGVLKTSWQKFEPDIISKFEKAGSKKKIKELEDYRLKKLVVLDDNSFFLLGEQYYKYIERSYDARTNVTTTTEHHNYNSIICSYFDSTGNHTWTDRIPKYQNTTNDYGRNSSFSVMNSGTDIYIFFNDTEKNNDVELGNYEGYSSMFNNRRSQISYVLVGTKGIQTRSRLLVDKDAFLLRAKLSDQLRDGSIYLMTETNRSNRIIKVDVATAG